MLTPDSVRIYWCSDGYYVIETFNDILGRRFSGSFAELAATYELDPADEDILKQGWSVQTGKLPA